MAEECTNRAGGQRPGLSACIQASQTRRRDGPTAEDSEKFPACLRKVPEIVEHREVIMTFFWQDALARSRLAA